MRATRQTTTAWMTTCSEGAGKAAATRVTLKQNGTSTAPVTASSPTSTEAEMRVIVELFGRTWMFTVQSARLSDCEVSSQPAEFEQAPPQDPHAVHGGQFEQGSGADAYTSDVVAKRFGFHGS